MRPELFLARLLKKRGVVRLSSYLRHSEYAAQIAPGLEQPNAEVCVKHVAIRKFLLVFGTFGTGPIQDLDLRLQNGEAYKLQICP